MESYHLVLFETSYVCLSNEYGNFEYIQYMGNMNSKKNNKTELTKIVSFKIFHTTEIQIPKIEKKTIEPYISETGLLQSQLNNPCFEEENPANFCNFR